MISIVFDHPPKNSVASGTPPVGGEFSWCMSAGTPLRREGARGTCGRGRPYGVSWFCEAWPVYMREGFEVALWVGFSSIAMVIAMFLQ